MRGLKKTVLMLTLFTPCLAMAQTVAISDLPRFACRFEVTDTLKRDAIDVSRIVDWRIDSTVTYERLNKLRKEWPYSKRTHEVYLDTSRQRPHPFSYSGYLGSSEALLYFYIMKDLFGSINVLSVWQSIDRNNVLFYCADVGNYDIGMGSAYVKRVVPFPDGSYLLHVKTMGGDAGESWGDDRFFRFSTPCNIEPLYSTETSRLTHGYSKVEILTDGLAHPLYRIVEVTKFLHDEEWRIGDFLNLGVIDSAQSTVIDLWDLSKAKFGIDTTSIELKYDR